jgi:hypothetical protein
MNNPVLLLVSVYFVSFLISGIKTNSIKTGKKINYEQQSCLATRVC